MTKELKQLFHPEKSMGKAKTPFSVLDTQEANEMVSFFDLLAKYDYEDKQREKSVLKIDPGRVPAPRDQF